MEELEQKTYRFELDFDKLEAWRDEKIDDLPVHGMISFYKACGIVDFLTEHKDVFGNQIAAIDSIACNFYTQQHIKNFIIEQWEVFSLSLVEHNRVEWNTTAYPKGVKHYNKNLSSRIKKSLSYDFLNYCPKLDDELPDNVLELSVPDPKVDELSSVTPEPEILET